MRLADVGSTADLLALELMGTRQRRCDRRERIEQLVAQVDELLLLRRLSRERLLPLAGARLREHGLDERLPQLRAALQGQREWISTRTVLHRAATADVLKALGDAAIPAFPLKGPLLSVELHGDATLRQSYDIDVLVHAEMLDPAARSLSKLGYSLADPVSRDLPPLHRTLSHPNEAMPDVELHWRVHWYEDRFSRDLLDMAGPTPVQQLASLLLFYVRDGLLGLRLAADIGAWTDRHVDTPAGALAEVIDTYPALRRAIVAGAVSADRLVGLPSTRLLGAYAADAGEDRRIAMAVRSASWDLAGDTDQLGANLRLVDGLCAPPGGIGAFLRRAVFCDAATLRDYGYDISEGDWVAFLRASLVHTAKILARMGIALARLHGNRVWSPLPV